MKMKTTHHKITQKNDEVPKQDNAMDNLSFPGAWPQQHNTPKQTNLNNKRRN